MTHEERQAANWAVAKWAGYLAMACSDECTNPDTCPMSYWEHIDNCDTRSHEQIDLWADTPEGAAWRERVEERLVHMDTGWSCDGVSHSHGRDDPAPFHVAYRKGNYEVSGKGATLAEARATAIAAAVEAVQKGEVRT